MEGIIRLIAKDLSTLETSIQELITTKISFIKEIVNHIIGSGGKRVRPILTILTAKLCGYQGEQHIPFGAIVEFIHTATLLHDDVVDNATTRRGSSTANTVWGNEPSVLVGDFLFSKSFDLMTKDGNQEILRVMSEATTALAEGEILELLKTSDANTTEEEYIEVIENKTAALFSAACEIGGILGKTDEDNRRSLRKFGYSLGMAFQLTDDILDYVSYDDILGKRVGTDLKEGKVTLPLIYALKSAGDKERSYIVQVLNKTKPTTKDFQQVGRIIRKYGGIEYASSITHGYIRVAKDSLNGFPPSPFKDALIDLTDYILKRET